MLILIDEAIKAKLSASYVLFDTWFASPTSFIVIKERNFGMIAMVKRTPNIRYRYNGEMKNANKKEQGRSCYLLSVMVEIIKNDVAILAKIVCIRNRNKRKDWLAIVSTNITLNEDEIIQLYGKRWDIEVFFKVCKSYLRLTNECHSLSYDTLIADVAILFSRYVLLTKEHRYQKDERSFGTLFFHLCDELADITFQHSLQLLMNTLIETLQDKLSLSKKQRNDLLDVFIAELPITLKQAINMPI